MKHGSETVDAEAWRGFFRAAGARGVAAIGVTGLRSVTAATLDAWPVALAVGSLYGIRVSVRYATIGRAAFFTKGRDAAWAVLGLSR